MKRYDKDEIENYFYGSDLWFSTGDRILVGGVNDMEFFADLFSTKVGKSFKKRLDCDENRAMLFKTYSELYPNEPIVRSKLGDVLHKLMLAYSFIDPHAEPEEPEDTRPRDALGRVMSPKAIAWQEFENWCNDPRTSMREINQLRRTDPGFAEFYANSAQQERTSTPVGDAVEDQNVRQAPSKRAVPADVLQFAQEYRTMSSAQVKTLLSPGLNPLGPAAAAESKRLFDAACACGAI